ncbi:MAG: RNA methyltransferase [Bacteroidetes bacterium]|nr:RNA methyltransferase [Bacteroidota bacterium]
MNDRWPVLTKRTLTGIKALAAKKERDSAGKFIVEGWKSVAEAAAAGLPIDIVLVDPTAVQDRSVLSRIERSAGTVYSATAKEIGIVSDTVTAQGIIAVLPQFDHSSVLPSVLKRKESVIVALDGINDPGNLGTIIRTCDWFGADAVLVSADSVDVYNPKVVRATMGSLFHLPVITGADLPAVLAQCRTAGSTIYSTELKRSEDLRTVNFPSRSVIIIGSESHGVSAQVSAVAHQRIAIPRIGKAESLNAAMACGIVLARMKL